jgi:hypothetical protein
MGPRANLNVVAKRKIPAATGLAHNLAGGSAFHCFMNLSEFPVSLTSNLW